MISRIMLDLPLTDSMRAVARYYQVILSREQSPRPAIEKLLEEPALPLVYRARVLQTLWATYVVEGDLNTATMLTIESARIASASSVRDLLSVAQATQQIAVIQSIHGDHKQALANLDTVFPLFRAIGKSCPAPYYDFLNSLAVELGEVGRIVEAEAACAITLASPYAALHPNWTETRDEIAAKRQSASSSFVAVNRACEVKPSPQIEPHRALRRSTLRLSTWLACEKASFQRASIVTLVSAVVVHDGPAQSILDRVRTSIRPRAPPAVAENNPRINP